jgi:hypothetical protein
MQARTPVSATKQMLGQNFVEKCQTYYNIDMKIPQLFNLNQVTKMIGVTYRRAHYAVVVLQVIEPIRAGHSLLLTSGQVEKLRRYFGD